MDFFYRYQTARGIIDSIFGPKAHKNFPRTRRLKGKGCDGKGVYPSELDNDDPEYVHKGVDLVAEKGDLVRGLARKQNVLIQMRQLDIKTEC